MKKIKRPKIGLVLGGGGPRGLALIGVIKILKENDIPIDLIAGTSIGAMIGGFYARNKDIGQVEKIALDINHKFMFSLLDPSFGKGLLGGKKVNDFIEKSINKLHFDQLDIPLSVVATDFKSGEPVIINSGDVSSAIRASISLPLVFKPVRREGLLLVDGGLSLPVPVEVAKDMGAELIIAVNLNADFFSSRDKLGDKFSFYKIAENSINLLQHNLSYQNVKNADIVINPKVGKTKWVQLLDAKNVITAGEDATREIIPQLKKIIRKQRRKKSRKNSKILSKIENFFGKFDK